MQWGTLVYFQGAPLLRRGVTLRGSLSLSRPLARERPVLHTAPPHHWRTFRLRFYSSSGFRDTNFLKSRMSNIAVRAKNKLKIAQA